MSVTAAKGFKASGITAGLKSSGRPDVSLVVNTGPLAVAAGVFTSNRVFAAPILVSREHLANGLAKAVILNSGCANACTGAKGEVDARESTDFTAQLLGFYADDVLVCSTGMIGSPLPVETLKKGITEACNQLRDDGGNDAAEAILTTDTVAKKAIFEAPGFTIGAMAKGAGMLAPGLATMLVVITTDAVIDSEMADRTLKRVTERTFDRVDSDGCMSTNDTVLLLASGASNVAPTENEFSVGLEKVCASLARQLVADAEGATHDIAVTVCNSASEEGAVAVGRAITRSNLFKAAVFGNDPNWGRIVSAAGTVPVEVAPFNPHELDVSINGVMVCRGGGLGDDRNLVDMSKREVQVVVDLHAGAAQATIWTNDLTHDYVHENSAYST